MQTEGSLSCSKQPACGPYPEQYDSSPPFDVIFLQKLLYSIILL
jgi:hypothetical protein